MDELSSKRDKWIRKSKYYYDNLVNYLKFIIPGQSRVIEIGCGTGYVLSKLNPSEGAGIDISEGMISIARKNYPDLNFYVMDCEDLNIDEKFDFILISDTIGYFDDVQRSFEQIRKLCTDETRIVITYINFLWLPVLNIAETFRLKMPQVRNNWLNISDITNLLQLTGYDIINAYKKFLFPVYVPLVSSLVNRFIASVPGVNSLCLLKFIVAKISGISRDLNSVSVIVPARNEKGNIREIVRRTPRMGEFTEIIFVEGNSTDGTFEEIENVCTENSLSGNLRFAKQKGKGKADAVRLGFEMAAGKILMILDADMTVPPEDLTKFYEAVTNGKGEFINGSRLVYPLEKDAMRTLNIFGNKFFSAMFTWILNQRIKDTLCGTKVISKSNYEKLKEAKKFLGNLDPFGDFDLLFGAAKMNLKITEIPVRYQARSYGETNISRFTHGWMLLKMTVFAMKKFKFN